MKTISNIQLNNRNNQFEFVKIGLKLSILLFVSFMFLTVIGIPISL